MKQAIFVGTVIDVDGVDGSRFMYSRQLYTNATGVFHGYPNMPIFLHDLIHTDPNTSITIQFYIGGRARIERGTRVVVDTERSLKYAPGDSSNLHMSDLRGIETYKELKAHRFFQIDDRAFWAKFDKENRDFRIQPGNFGIEG